MVYWTSDVVPHRAASSSRGPPWVALVHRGCWRVTTVVGGGGGVQTLGCNIGVRSLRRDSTVPDKGPGAEVPQTRKKGPGMKRSGKAAETSF